MKKVITIIMVMTLAFSAFTAYAENGFLANIWPEFKHIMCSTYREFEKTEEDVFRYDEDTREIWYYSNSACISSEYDEVNSVYDLIPKFKDMLIENGVDNPLVNVGKAGDGIVYVRFYSYHTDFRKLENFNIGGECDGEVHCINILCWRDYASMNGF